MQLLILVAVFFGVVMLIVAVYGVIYRESLEAADAAREQLRMSDGGVISAVSILRDDRSSEIPFLNRLLTGRALTTRIAIELARAGSDWKAGQILLSTIAFAVAGLVVGQRYGIFGSFSLALVCSCLPMLWLRRMQRRRVAAFESQLPEALDMLVNALQAGYSLQAAMDFVGRETPAPLGPELGRFYDEQRLGMEVRIALLRFQERVGTVDAKMFVTSLLIQRETGGNLSEVLTNLAVLMRERVTFRLQLATLTAEPRMSARVLASLPILVILLLGAISPNFMRPLLESATGHKLLVYAASSVIVGYVIMSRIADVEI
ncbi:MAG TPA: type II secretion system F family protein [Gemmatimonadaceae bacterium]|jgi:tight adherence protein B|nr:type II secretion system F family protein [Gemmatimonadaceae bacterium]